MRIDLYDVEHGGCTLITADTGARMLIDCGHNSSTDWRPSTHFPAGGITFIDMFVSTNMDSDHVSDLPNLSKKVALGSLLRNPTIASATLQSMKTDGISPGIAALSSMLTAYTAPAPQTDWGTLSYKWFCNSYGVFTDTNNLSLVLFVDYGNLHMVFPGDLEKEGWRNLVTCNADFRAALAAVNVFVASHHGRENGCCDEVFENCCKPAIVIMSDKATVHDTQETAGWYRQRCHGINHNGKQRHVFTTRSDGKMTITGTPDGQINFWTAND
jgi:beta-lactamase superfamily II metal-dependent hydrolase